MLDDKLVKELLKPLDPARIKAREKAGQSLSYLEGWDVVEKANGLFGFGGWGYEVTTLRCVGEQEFPGKKGPAFRVGYISTVKVTVEGVTFEEVGFGNDINYSNIIDAHELAAKESVTDGMKRCLKNFGNQFGLCLYDKEQRGVGGEQGPEEASEEQVNALYALLKKAGHPEAWIGDVLTNKRQKEGGILPKEWVERQIANQTAAAEPANK